MRLQLCDHAALQGPSLSALADGVDPRDSRVYISRAGTSFTPGVEIATLSMTSFVTLLAVVGAYMYRQWGNA